jgi:hypothetical protein
MVSSTLVHSLILSHKIVINPMDKTIPYVPILISLSESNSLELGNTSIP